MELDIQKIQVGEFDRRVTYDDAELDSLCASIRRVGILVPVIVVEDGETFTLVAGHRRLEAAKRIGLKSVPAVVSDKKASEANEVSLAENIFRKDLTPVELASAIAEVLNAGVLSVKEISGALHRSEYWVHEQVAMLAWPAEVLEAVHDGVISVAAAANLAEVDDDSYREFLLRNAVENGATARTTAAWLQAYRASQPPSEAILVEPAPGHPPAQPLIPQTPCFACGQVLRSDQVSHLPLCAGCITAIRNVGS